MITKFAARLSLSRDQILQIARRNIGISSVVLQKADPIQQIFVDKVREYAQKKK